MKATKNFVGQAGNPRAVVAMALAAALLAAACAPGAAARADAPYDLQFIDTMTEHHAGAVAMAQAAGARARSAELKDFARKVIADQSAEIAQMAAWRGEWFPGAAKAVNMAMPGMAASMKGMKDGHLQMLAGPEFDRMFVAMMIPHHEGALLMAREAQDKSEREEIKDLARRIIEAQRAEIEMMRQWQEEWGSAR